MRKLYGFIALMLCFASTSFAENTTKPQSVISPLETGVWISGVFESSDESDFFSFEAQGGIEYIIIASPDSLEQFQLGLYDTDGTTVLALNDPWDENSKYLEWTCLTSGQYLIKIEPYNGSTGRFQISVQSANSRLKYLLQLLKNNRCQEALDDQLQFLEIAPDDPESNLYAAVLRIINLIENPDQQLVSIYNEFQIDFDLFPSGSRIDNPTDTMMKVSEIQLYGVENILPVIDLSLEHLEKVINQSDATAFIPPIQYDKKVYPDEVNEEETDLTAARTGWVQIDNGDVKISSGILLLMKSMILALNAFDLGMEPKVAAEKYYPFPTDPIVLDSLLIEYPDLLSGRAEIQQIFRSALKNWLLGTQNIRDGLESVAIRKTPQNVHLFYLNTGQDAQSIARYLSLLDRVFAGLLAVTGGDINGDSVVNYWDLHELHYLSSFKQ